MRLDDRDVRMIVVAFEDAVTWCETLADLSARLLEAAASGRTLKEADANSAAAQIEETRRYLESNRSEVQRIKLRAGIV